MGLHFQLMLLVFLSVLSAFTAHPTKSACTAKELARQDCRLTFDTYNLRLLKKTVAWSDGTWHSVDDLPLTGEGVVWEKAQFEFINGWPILQLWIWDAGQGESQVQSLHWYVADAEKQKFTLLAEGVVRKRRLSEEKKLIFDAMEPHALKPLKTGALEWTLRKEKKLFERVKHGI